MKRKNLAPKSRAGSAGYDVVIGPRKKHFTSHADAYRHAMDQQNKGVHSVFVIVDAGSGARETYSRGGKKNPGKSSLRPVERRKRKTAAISKNKRKNPESGAVAMRESFTGIPSKKTVVVGEDIHVHSHLAALGELVSMRVKTLKGDTFDICFGKEENPKTRKSALSKVRGWIDRRGKAVSKILKSTSDLWINPKRTNSGGVVLLCCTEDGKNLMIQGGSQALDLKALNMGEFADKESVIVGEIKTIDYFATKDWKDGKKPETAIYTHKLNEETGGPRPMLRYSTRDKRCYIDGGLYSIKRPMSGSTSPGIEN